MIFVAYHSFPCEPLFDNILKLSDLLLSNEVQLLSELFVFRDELLDLIELFV